MKRKFLAVSTLSSCLVVSNVEGKNISGTAHAAVFIPLSLSGDTPINFGIIGPEDGTCKMSAGGIITGENGQNCSGLQTPGEFTISGADGQIVELSASPGATVDGVTFIPKLEGSNTAMLMSGNATINMIGDLVLASATPGSKAINYTFTANYQ